VEVWDNVLRGDWDLLRTNSDGRTYVLVSEMVEAAKELATEFVYKQWGDRKWAAEIRNVFGVKAGQASVKQADGSFKKVKVLDVDVEEFRKRLEDMIYR